MLHANILHNFTSSRLFRREKLVQTKNENHHKKFEISETFTFQNLTSKTTFNFNVDHFYSRLFTKLVLNSGSSRNFRFLLRLPVCEMTLKPIYITENSA